METIKTFFVEKVWPENVTAPWGVSFSNGEVFLGVVLVIVACIFAAKKIYDYGK